MPNTFKPSGPNSIGTGGPAHHCYAGSIARRSRQNIVQFITQPYLFPSWMSLFTPTTLSFRILGLSALSYAASAPGASSPSHPPRCLPCQIPRQVHHRVGQPRKGRALPVPYLPATRRIFKRFPDLGAGFHPHHDGLATARYTFCPPASSSQGGSLRHGRDLRLGLALCVGLGAGPRLCLLVFFPLGLLSGLVR